MTQQEQLTILIEKALDNGWKLPWENEILSDLDVDDDGIWDIRDYYVKEHYSIDSMLFGDNLSFLKALVSSEWVDQSGTRYQDADPLRAGVWTTEYHSIATRLVNKDDNQRIPWLYSQVFGGQDD